MKLIKKFWALRPGPLCMGGCWGQAIEAYHLTLVSYYYLYMEQFEYSKIGFCENLGCGAASPC